jgi:hypothetical protein
MICLCVATATVASRTFLEFLVGQMLDQLRKDGSASVYFALLLCLATDAKHRKNRSDSNRSRSNLSLSIM